MNDILQIVLPFVTALSVLAVFHAVAYLHLRLSEVEEEDDGELLHS